MPATWCFTSCLVPSRSAHLVSRYRPRAPIIAVTRNDQTARQAHLYRGIFPVLCKEPAHDAWAEDVDLRVNLGMNVGESMPPQPHLGNGLVGRGGPEHLRWCFWGYRWGPVTKGEELAACVVTVSDWEMGDGSCISTTASDWEMGQRVCHGCLKIGSSRKPGRF